MFVFLALVPPQPPSQNMNMGPGGMSQSASTQGLHSQSNLNDSMSSSLPTPSLMQGQIANGKGPPCIVAAIELSLPDLFFTLLVDNLQFRVV